VSSRLRRTTRVSSGVALLAAGLVLAACSSSSSGGGSSTSTSSAGGSASPATSSSTSPATSTGGSTTSTLPKTLVFSPLSLAPPALKGLSVGVKGYAGSKGWQVIVQDPNFDANKQAQDLNVVIDSGRAGAAWIIANSADSMKDVITHAQAKGVPLLLNGTPESYGFSGAQPGLTFDAIDYAAAGTAMGDQLGKCVNTKLGGNAKVLFATSTVGQQGKKEFETAALAGLKAAAPNAKVVSTLITSDRAKAQTDIGAALQGNPGINALMSSQDEGTLGGIGAFKAAGKSLPCITEFGGNAEVLALVKKGTIFASVALQFAADMTQSFDTLVKMQADPKAPGLLLTVPQKIFTASS
jgi:ABC-type sugar transport system substrate-binding protein